MLTYPYLNQGGGQMQHIQKSLGEEQRNESLGIESLKVSTRLEV